MAVAPLTRLEIVHDGRLCLTTLVELRDVLDGDGVVAILDRAAGCTEEQVKDLVASLRPQQAPLDLFRRLPAPAEPEVSSGPNQTLLASAPAQAAQPVVVAPQRPTGRLQSIARQTHVLRITVGADFVADLEAVRQALSHKIPAGRLEDVLEQDFGADVIARIAG